MTQSEFNHLLSRIKVLSPEQVRQLRQELDRGLAGAETGQPAMPAWKQVLDNMKDIPDEEFDRMPADSSEQLDHYVYGTPKRPTA